MSGRHDPTVGDPPASAPRGPLDARVLALSPALRVHLIASTVAAGFVALAVLVQAEALGHLLPRLVDGDGSATALLAWWLVAVAVVRAAVAWALDRSATGAIVAVRSAIRARVVDRLVRVRADHRHELGPADAAALSGPALDALEPYIRSYLPGLPVAVIVPIAAGLRILGADLAAAVIVAAIVPVVPISMVAIGRFTEQQQARQWDALQRLAGRFLDVIAGLATLRLFGRADAQVERVRQVTEQYRRATMRTLRVAFLSALVLELLATLSIALVAVSLGVRLAHGSLDLETALVVLLLTPECLVPIRRVAAAFHAATAGVDAAVEVGRVAELERRPSGERTCIDGPSEAPLLVDGISVASDRRRDRLPPTSLEVAPGSILAVTGPSGSGKSTLLDVVRGAVPTSTGSVAVGSVALDDVELTARAAALRWVPQRPRPLGATIRESVQLGTAISPQLEAATDRALDRLGLAHLADQAPVDSSGGERRRTALARVLASIEATDDDRRPRFVLVDEPTAQLDERNAERVRAALRWIAERGIGVLVATHDPILLARADEVVRLASEGAPASEPVVVRGERRDGVPGALGHLPPAHLEAPPVPDPVAGWASSLGDISPAGAGPALGWVLRCARRQRARLAAGAALGVLTEACSLGLAATAAWLVVRAGAHPSLGDLGVAILAVRAFAVGKGVLRYGERLTSHDATLRLLADLRASVVERLARLAPSGLPKQADGDLLTRLVDDVDHLQDLFLRVLGPAIAALAVATAAGIATTAIDPPGGIALLLAIACVGVVVPVVAHRVARARGHGAAHARGELASRLVALAEDAEEVVACGATLEWTTAIGRPARELDDIDRRQGHRSAILLGLTAAAPALATAAVVAVTGPAGAHLSAPALGVLVLLPLAAVELVAPLGAAGEALARVEASATRVFALVSRPDPLPEPATPPVEVPAPELELEDVALAWPGDEVVVTGVSWRSGQGDRLVVTGPSGSGKSTLAATLVGFIAPRAGRFEVGGVAASALGGDALRTVVTWCSQDPWFADDTLAANLRIADPHATDDQIEAALTTVHLGAWRRGLPGGLEARLHRDASTMSGGERQRLALARALLGGQEIVVLDEPTAHLDEDLAAGVLADLVAALDGRGIVLITHAPEEADVLGAPQRAAITVDGAGAPARWVLGIS